MQQLSDRLRERRRRQVLILLIFKEDYMVLMLVWPLQRAAKEAGKV